MTTNPTWTPERIADVTVAVQAALTEAQRHEAAMTPGPWEAIPDDYSSGHLRGGPDDEFIGGIDGFAEAAGIAYMRNTLPQYIARLQQDLDALHELAEAEEWYGAIEADYAQNRDDEGLARELCARRAEVNMLRQRAEQIAACIGGREGV